MRKIIVLMLVFSFLGAYTWMSVPSVPEKPFTQPRYGLQGKVNIKLTLPKTQYFPTEYIHGTFIITNYSEAPVEIHYLDMCSRVYDKQTHRSVTGWGSVVGPTDYFDVVQPNQNIRGKHLIALPMIKVLKGGRYYCNVWYEGVYSNKVEFEIVEEENKAEETEPISKEDRIKQLIAELEKEVDYEGGNWQRPLEAADDLAKLNAKEALPAMIKFLKDGKRVPCCCGSLLDESIIKLGGKSVIPEMIELLESNNFSTLVGAIHILEALEAKEAIPALMKKLMDKNTDKDIKIDVIYALAELDAKEAIPEISKLTGEEHWPLCEPAKYALEKLEEEQKSFMGPQILLFTLEDKSKWKKSWDRGEKVQVSGEYGSYEQLVWPSDLQGNAMEVWAKGLGIIGLSKEDIQRNYGKTNNILINESNNTTLLVYKGACVIFYLGKCIGCAPSNENYEKYFMQSDL